MSEEPLAFLPIAGVRLGTAAAGIRYRDRPDLVVLELAPGSVAAGVFTRNAFCAAPVTLARRHLAAMGPRYLLINSGNANAGTGGRGMTDAEACCRHLAGLAGCAPEQVLPFSTGVIGEYLPVDKIAAALPTALGVLDAQGWAPAARAIMTTDTLPKLVSRTAQVAGHPFTVTGMAKGAGMICPNMATMLAFVATEAAVSRPMLERCLQQAVADTFNAITVDGDTSTNDACVLVATGAGAAPRITEADTGAFHALCGAVHAVCEQLASAIVSDAEGATKRVTVVVEGAGNEAEAKTVAYTIAHSPLVKTALFASDPNWGRILAAVGRAGLAELDIGRVRIWLDEVSIVRDGGRDPAYREALGTAVMGQPAFTIRVDLGRGLTSWRLLTCDLSYDYVRINAEYRT